MVKARVKARVKEDAIAEAIGVNKGGAQKITLRMRHQGYTHVISILWGAPPIFFIIFKF